MKHIRSPSEIRAAGKVSKVIEEYFGRVNSDTAELSIARMISPEQQLHHRCGRWRRGSCKSGGMGEIQYAFPGRGRVYSRLYSSVLSRNRESRCLVVLFRPTTWLLKRGARRGAQVYSRVSRIS